MLPSVRSSVIAARRDSVPYRIVLKFTSSLTRTRLRASFVQPGGAR